MSKTRTTRQIATVIAAIGLVCSLSVAVVGASGPSLYMSVGGRAAVVSAADQPAAAAHQVRAEYKTGFFPDGTDALMVWQPDATAAGANLLTCVVDTTAGAKIACPTNPATKKPPSPPGKKGFQTAYFSLTGVADILHLDSAGTITLSNGVGPVTGGALPKGLKVTASGGSGNDFLFGHSGTDLLSGGNGRDYIRGNLGSDTLKGGRSRDKIKAKDGKKDVVRCGRGRDKAWVDSQDDVAGCERVR
jgi:Ca2+-binding RTX toxin-like protein